jgi:hypothetical protein
MHHGRLSETSIQVGIFMWMQVEPHNYAFNICYIFFVSVKLWKSWFWKCSVHSIRARERASRRVVALSHHVTHEIKVAPPFSQTHLHPYPAPFTPSRLEPLPGVLVNSSLSPGTLPVRKRVRVGIRFGFSLLFVSSRKLNTCLWFSEAVHAFDHLTFLRARSPPPR